MIEMKNVSKSVNDGGVILNILNDVNLVIGNEERVLLVGQSGSGKSTLLGLLSLIDRPTSGEILYDGFAVSHINDDARTKFRGENVSIIFQSFELVPFLTVKENIMLPLLVAGMYDETNVIRLAERVGIGHLLERNASVLSGGEQQRVAVIRALVRNGAIVCADEPTGSLDEKNGAIIRELLLSLCKEEGRALFVISHDESLRAYFDTVYKLEGGVVYKL